MSVDEERGIAYVPLGTARYDFYGGNRPGDNLFGNSLVALDVKTGKLKWYYQMVHHDLWDYDLPAAPKLLTVQHNGRAVDIVAQPQSTDSCSPHRGGTPLCRSKNERRQSDVPGEYTIADSAVSTLLPPTYDSPSRKKISTVPAGRRTESASAASESRNEGLFTPPAGNQMPGNNGGANWGSSAVDPTKGTMYVLSKETDGHTVDHPWDEQDVEKLRAFSNRGGGAGGAGRGGAVPHPETLSSSRSSRRPASAGGTGSSCGAHPEEEAGSEDGGHLCLRMGDLTRYTQNYQFFYGTSTGMSTIGTP
jgi:glucose dehydrogenase